MVFEIQHSAEIASFDVTSKSDVPEAHVHCILTVLWQNNDR